MTHLMDKKLRTRDEKVHTTWMGRAGTYPKCASFSLHLIASPCGGCGFCYSFSPSIWNPFLWRLQQLSIYKKENARSFSMLPCTLYCICPSSGPISDLNDKLKTQKSQDHDKSSVVMGGSSGVSFIQVPVLLSLPITLRVSCRVCPQQWQLLVPLQ